MAESRACFETGNRRRAGARPASYWLPWEAVTRTTDENDAYWSGSGGGRWLIEIPDLAAIETWRRLLSRAHPSASLRDRGGVQRVAAPRRPGGFSVIRDEGAHMPELPHPPRRVDLGGSAWPAPLASRLHR